MRLSVDLESVDVDSAQLAQALNGAASSGAFAAISRNRRVEGQTELDGIVRW